MEIFVLLQLTRKSCFVRSSLGAREESHTSNSCFVRHNNMTKARVRRITRRGQQRMLCINVYGRATALLLFRLGVIKRVTHDDPQATTTTTTTCLGAISVSSRNAFAVRARNRGMMVACRNTIRTGAESVFVIAL